MQEIIQPPKEESASQLKYPLDPVTQNILNPQRASTAPTMLYGRVTLTAGTATIYDARITTESEIFVTNKVSTSAADANIAADCFTGYATIYIGGGLSSDTIGYLIII